MNIKLSKVQKELVNVLKRGNTRILNLETDNSKAKKFYITDNFNRKLRKVGLTTLNKLISSGIVFKDENSEQEYVLNPMYLED